MLPARPICSAARRRCWPRSGIGWLIIGIPLSIAALKALIRFPRALVSVLIAAVVIPGLLLVQGGRRGLSAPSPGGVRVEMLDIGQGDAFLVRSSSGQSVLVDTGPPGGGVGDAVASAGLERLDGVLLTHLDLDHIGGFGEVLDRFEVETVFFEEQDEAIRSAIAREGAAGRRLPAGDGLDLDPGRVTVLSPHNLERTAEIEVTDDGHRSPILVVRGAHGGRR